MAVKAKFYVGNVSIHAINEDGTPKYGAVRLNVVCRGAVNKQWAAATPVGHVEMNINSPALAHFAARVGKEISVTFEDASADPATHEYEPLSEEIQAATYADATCTECGHPREAHTS